MCCSLLTNCTEHKEGKRKMTWQNQQQRFPTEIPDVVVSTIGETINFMQSRSESFVNELKDLLEIASASNNPAGLNAMAASLSNKLRRIGMTSTIFEHPSGNAVLGEILGDNPEADTILLLGHHDTVYAEGVSAPRVFIEGDKFYGPGSIDMKACLLQAIYALEGLLWRKRYRDFKKILFLSVPDEEVPTRNHMQLIEQVCQEKPFALVLEGALTPGNVVIRRRGHACFKLSANGVSSHAGSNPEAGRSAVLEIAHQTVQFCKLDKSIESISINAAPIAGGVLPNIIADFAEVSFDVRFLRMEDYHAVVDQWQELMKNQLVAGVTLTLTASKNPTPPMEATEASLAMAEKVRLLTSLLQVEYDPEDRGGGSDACRTSALGCPTLDAFGAVGSAPHSPNEHILLQYIPKKTAMLAGMIAFLTTRDRAIG
jgi:glutamate carboxypeptidase